MIFVIIRVSVKFSIYIQYYAIPEHSSIACFQGELFSQSFDQLFFIRMTPITPLTMDLMTMVLILIANSNKTKVAPALVAVSIAAGA